MLKLEREMDICLYGFTTKMPIDNHNVSSVCTGSWASESKKCSQNTQYPSRLPPSKIWPKLVWKQIPQSRYHFGFLQISYTGFVRIIDWLIQMGVPHQNYSFLFQSTKKKGLLNLSLSSSPLVTLLLLLRTSGPSGIRQKVGAGSI